MAGPTKNSEGGKKMSKNEIPKQDPKQKKGLTNALKYFFGVGDAGFVLMKMCIRDRYRSLLKKRGRPTDRSGESYC